METDLTAALKISSSSNDKSAGEYFCLGDCNPPNHRSTRFSSEYSDCVLTAQQSRRNFPPFALKHILVFFIMVFLALAGDVQAQRASCPHTPEGPPTDRDVLILLYCATGGSAWESQSGWLTSSQLSDWQNVDTSSAGEVEYLDLGENNLVGTIPTELGNLSKLDSLYLYENTLSGTIPTELLNSNIPYFQLYLRNNELSGTIPTELGSLTDLWRLYLNNNRLSGTIPIELTSLTDLWILGLNNNRLSGTISTRFGNMTKLTHLRLNHNQLSGTIPDELENLGTIFVLNLSHNQLSGTIPTELGNLIGLRYLSLNNNQLSGTIPGELFRDTEVEFLDNLNLHDNQLSGAIPIELLNMAELKKINLSNNPLLEGTLPLGLMNLRDLGLLNISGTDLCAPDNADFQDWLSTIDFFGSTCSP